MTKIKEKCVQDSSYLYITRRSSTGSILKLSMREKWKGLVLVLNHCIFYDLKAKERIENEILPITPAKQPYSEVAMRGRNTDAQLSL